MKHTDYSEKMNNNRKKRRAADAASGHKSQAGGKKQAQKGGLKKADKKESRKETLKKETGDLRDKYRWIMADETSGADTDVCPLAGKCGGCMYQGVSYEQQLATKQKQVTKLLKRYADVLPIIGMDNPYHYRNKVHAVFDRKKNGVIVSGTYKEGTHDVVNVDACQIEDALADAIIVDIRGLLKSFKIKIYDEDTQYGLLRHVLVRRGFSSGQVMVVLVLTSPILPSKNNFVKALTKLHPEITTVVLNVNEKRTNLVLGERNITLYGKGYIEDTLCGCTFRISPSSFYQVNPVQTKVLYDTAMAYAGLTGKETVIDAYCGIGTIGMVAAARAKEVVGVELNTSAVRDAVKNAKRNGVKNICFYNEDAAAYMTKRAAEGERVDVVFMDPPRSGSTEEFLDALKKLAPKRVVYISCNPETLARDLAYMKKQGYTAEKCQPVDMFPFSGHVETIVLMSRVAK